MQGQQAWSSSLRKNTGTSSAMQMVSSGQRMSYGCRWWSRYKLYSSFEHLNLMHMLSPSYLSMKTSIYCLRMSSCMQPRVPRIPSFFLPFFSFFLSFFPHNPKKKSRITRGCRFAPSRGHNFRSPAQIVILILISDCDCDCDCALRF